MKGIRQALQRWRRDRRGFTLAEITVAMAVGAFIMGGVFLVYHQLFAVTATNSNYMVSFRQVQNAGDWITNDTLMAQEVNVMPGTGLSGEISDTYTGDIIVDSTADFPGSGLILIENEIIEYSGTTGTSFTGCTRGYDGSEITGHADNATVTLYVKLEDAIDADDDEINVSSTHGFPASGVICIEDELIQYSSKNDDTFFVYDDPDTGGVTEGRGTNAASHASGTSLNFFVSLGWTNWEGDNYQVVYRLNGQRELVRCYFYDEAEKDADGVIEPYQIPQWELQSSDAIAEAIDAGQTSSDWNASESQLEVRLTADAGGYVLGRFGEQSYEATRTYKIHPRPLI